jgi:hypothetical protein
MGHRRTSRCDVWTVQRAVATREMRQPLVSRFESDDASALPKPFVVESKEAARSVRGCLFVT